MPDHNHGLACAAWWLKIICGNSQDPIPWLSVVKTTFHRKGNQSWYSAMKPMMMKKWKWASIDPWLNPTNDTEQKVRPAVARAEAGRRRLIHQASAAHPAGTATTSAHRAGE